FDPGALVELVDALRLRPLLDHSTLLDDPELCALLRGHAANLVEEPRQLDVRETKPARLLGELLRHMPELRGVDELFWENHSSRAVVPLVTVVERLWGSQSEES